MNDRQWREDYEKYKAFVLELRKQEPEMSRKYGMPMKVFPSFLLYCKSKKRRATALLSLCFLTEKQTEVNYEMPEDGWMVPTPELFFLDFDLKKGVSDKRLRNMIRWVEELGFLEVKKVGKTKYVRVNYGKVIAEERRYRKSMEENGEPPE